MSWRKNATARICALITCHVWWALDHYRGRADSENNADELSASGQAVIDRLDNGEPVGFLILLLVPLNVPRGPSGRLPFPGPRQSSVKQTRVRRPSTPFCAFAPNLGNARQPAPSAHRRLALTSWLPPRGQSMARGCGRRQRPRQNHGAARYQSGS